MSTADPLQALHGVSAQLRSMDVPFALVGGLAVSVRAEVRTTRDIDIALDLPDDAEFFDAVRAFVSRGYIIDVWLEQESIARLATCRMLSPDDMAVDLLAASCGIEPEVVSEALPVQLAGDSVPIARAEELLAMKILSVSTRRAQDRLDIESLLRVNPSLDLDRVRALLSLIEQRGFDRGEDLPAKLEAALADLETIG